MCKNSKNGKKKGIKNNLIKIEFVLCAWYKINMENMEEIQKLLQEFESLEQEGVEYTIKIDLTLDEIKFLIYMRKNKIDCDELRKNLSNKF